MSRFSETRLWLRENARLEPALLESPSFAEQLAARCRELKLAAAPDEGDAQYAELLSTDSIEAANARSMVSVPETWLFRGLPSFELLRKRLGSLLASGRTDVRILSAGCATGAEPVSLAVAALSVGFGAERCAIDAVDVNPEAIAATKLGRFRGMSARDPLPTWAQSWFVVRDGEVNAKQDATSMIRAELADLFFWAPPVLQYDAIFCRNVFIYLDREGRSRLAQRFTDWLAHDGVLVLGHADAGPEVIERLRPFGEAGAFAFSKAAAARTPAAPTAASTTSGPKTSGSDRRPATATRVAAKGDARAPAVGTFEECRALIANRREADAERAIKSLLLRTPDSVEGHVLLGEVQLQRGAIGPAEESLRRAIYLDPHRELALVRLAEIAERTGRRALADRYRARAIERHLGDEGAT